MQPFIAYALASAALFGASTPIAKLLLESLPPLVLAGLLYAGSGCGLVLVLFVRAIAGRLDRVALPHGADWIWLSVAVLLGGVLAPVALLYSLTLLAASTAALLLNLETVFTSALAWWAFRENVDRRIAMGMLAIVSGGALLAWSPAGIPPSLQGVALIAAACLLWGIDNNVTRKISANDAVAVAAVKGLVAGGTNLGLAVALGVPVPDARLTAVAASVGFTTYGLSLVLFVVALRHLGTARTSAYFSIAPFFGAALGVAVQHDPVTWQLAAAGTLMGIGAWLHVTERHEHWHVHAPLEHAHAHRHDEHHRHPHDFAWDGREPHVHRHRHEPLGHRHRHYPDIHHRHRH